MYINALPSVIPIGKQGENHATTVEIDAAAWGDEYPGLTIAISMTTPQDSTAASPFLVSGVTLSGDTLTWVVGNDATQYSGLGTIVVRGLLDGAEVRSARTQILIDPGHPATGDAPELMADWLAEADALRQEVADGAAAASGSAGTASTKAGEAASSAQAASTSAGNANTAKLAAETAKDTAATKANEAGQSAQAAAESAAVYDALAGTVAGHTSQLADIAHKISTDFLLPAASFPWNPSLISNGSISGGAGSEKHPGVAVLVSSTSQNSGVKLGTEQWGILASKSIETTIIFATPANLSTVTARLGYHDAATSAAPTDGIYAEINGTTLTGQTANNGSISTTGTNYTLQANTWYRLKIAVNASATAVEYTLYADDSNTVLWTDTLNTNLPTSEGRNVGSAIIATSSGTSAINLLLVDYIDSVFPLSRRVR